MPIGPPSSVVTLNKDQLGGFGVNYDEDITSLTEAESPNAIDVEFDETLVRKRPGYRTITPTSLGPNEQGYSLKDFGVAEGDRRLVSHQGNKVYTITNLEGAQTVIRSSVPRTQSFFAEVKRFLIHTFDDHSTEYYWDGATTTMSVLSPSAPGFKHAIETQGFLLGGNIDGEPLRIYYEDTSSMIGGAFADFFTLPGGRDDELTGFFELNGVTYATTKTGIFRISFVGGVTVFRFERAIDTTGAVPRTMRTIPNDVLQQAAESTLFLGYDQNLYTYNGANVAIISDKYRKPNNDTPIALGLLDRSRLNNSQAVYDPIRRTYRLFATKLGDDDNNFAFNIDVRNLSYFPYKNMKFASTTVAEDGVGRLFLVGADYEGRIHKMFTDVNDDNGIAITEFYEAPPMLRALERYKKVQTVDMYFTPVGNHKLQLEDRTDFDKTWKTRTTLNMYRNRDRFLGENTVLGETAELGSQDEVLKHHVNVPATANIYRFRIKTGGTDGARCRDDRGTVAGAGGGTTLTGTSTEWTSDMTSANGWKVWINDGVHKNEIYTFDYVSATSATVSTMVGTSPANDFTGAEYEVFKTGDPACAKRWELLKIDYNAKPLSLGRGSKIR
jgi:hypothetical protein